MIFAKCLSNEELVCRIYEELHFVFGSVNGATTLEKVLAVL